jgi:hypothetical protein
VPAKVYHALSKRGRCGGNDHPGHRGVPRAFGGERRGDRFTPGPRAQSARSIREQAP